MRKVIILYRIAGSLFVSAVPLGMGKIVSNSDMYVTLFIIVVYASIPVTFLAIILENIFRKKEKRRNDLLKQVDTIASELEE